MKGIVFNLLERAVTDEYGEDTWDALLDEANVDGTYTAVGTYPHEDLHALVAAASAKLGVSGDDVQRWFGRASIPLLAERYPGFFDEHATLDSFLLSLNDIIHPEVRKLFPGAYAPSFEIDASVPGRVALGYESHRGLCMFAEGLVLGAADKYGVEVDVDQSECTTTGADRCVLVCTIGT